MSKSNIIINNVKKFYYFKKMLNIVHIKVGGIHIKKRIIANASLVKNINKGIILNTIKEHGQISRSELVHITKLALPSALNVVGELLSEEIIIEDGKVDSSMGRKPIILRINADYGFIFGVNIGRKLSIILLNFNDEILEEVSEITYMKEGPRGFVNQIKRIIYEIIEARSIPREKILGIGVATLGTRFKTGSLINMSEFQGWQDVDYGKLLEEILPEFKTICEYITVCGAVGERWFGKGRDVKNYIYLYIDYGVGGAAIIDGKLYKGKQGTYPVHIGHHIVQINGEQCYCGSKGCLEAYTSSNSIVTRLKKRLISGERSALSEKVQGEDYSMIDFNAVLEAFNNKDPLVMEVIIEAGKAMGIGIANVINVFNPERIILGGEISYALPDFVEEAIRTARENVFQLDAKDVEIVVSDRRHYPEAYGAAALVVNKIFEIPEA